MLCIECKQKVIAHRILVMRISFRQIMHRFHQQIEGPTFSLETFPVRRETYPHVQMKDISEAETKAIVSITGALNVSTIQTGTSHDRMHTRAHTACSHTRMHTRLNIKMFTFYEYAHIFTLSID